MSKLTPDIDDARDRVPWSLVGAVEGTELTYDPARPPEAPERLNAGQRVMFITDEIVPVAPRRPYQPRVDRFPRLRADQVWKVLWSGDESRVVVIDHQRSIDVYETKTGALTATVRQTLHTLGSAALSRDGRILYCIGTTASPVAQDSDSYVVSARPDESNDLWRYDLERGTRELVLSQRPPGGVSALASSWNGERLAAAIQVYGLERELEVTRLITHSSAGSDVWVQGATHQRLISGVALAEGDEPAVRVFFPDSMEQWNASSKSRAVERHLPASVVSARVARYSADWRRITFVDQEGRRGIYDVDGDDLVTFKAPLSVSQDAAPSPREWVGIHELSRGFKVHRWAGGRQRATLDRQFEGDKGDLRWLAPSGRSIFIATPPRELRLIHLSSGEDVRLEW